MLGPEESDFEIIAAPITSLPSFSVITGNATARVQNLLPKANVTVKLKKQLQTPFDSRAILLECINSQDSSDMHQEATFPTSSDLSLSGDHVKQQQHKVPTIKIKIPSKTFADKKEVDELIYADTHSTLNGQNVNDDINSASKNSTCDESADELLSYGIHDNETNYRDSPVRFKKSAVKRTPSKQRNISTLSTPRSNSTYNSSKSPTNSVVKSQYRATPLSIKPCKALNSMSVHGIDYIYNF